MDAAKKIFITRMIPEKGIGMLEAKGYEIDISPKDRPLTKKELIKYLEKKPYDAVLSLLTDQIDQSVFAACPTARIFANFAVGFNNFNLADATAAGVMLTNTPAGSAESVAQHTIALLLALANRVTEGDRFVRSGEYRGWDPMLLWGTELKDKIFAVVGGGHIGLRAAEIAAKGFGMKIAYYDIKQNESIERELGATFSANLEELLAFADVVSLHVPLLPATAHLINAERLALMKKTAFLINTARGPIIDEEALVNALQHNIIAGAGLDVFENEPELASGLGKLPNVVLTPHIASATEGNRNEMAIMAAHNIIEFLEGRVPPNVCA